MKYGELVKILKKNGCKLLRDGGNHEIWITPNGRKIPVPRHAKEIAKGTALSILKSVGVE